jgi:hypothetical protein
VSLSSAQQSDSPHNPRHSTEELQAKRHLAQVADGLAELYELLENYGPTWYKEDHRERALSALRLVKKRQEAE